MTLDFADDPLLLWNVSGEGGDGRASFALVGGWAAPQVATVALRQDGEWVAADTAEIPGAQARGWAVAVAGGSWMTPFDDIRAYPRHKRAANTWWFVVRRVRERLPAVQPST